MQRLIGEAVWLLVDRDRENQMETLLADAEDSGESIEIDEPRDLEMNGWSIYYG